MAGLGPAIVVGLSTALHLCFVDDEVIRATVAVGVVTCDGLSLVVATDLKVAVKLFIVGAKDLIDL